ncbi:MAG: SDR family oxidoreductase, partial [candidate division WOR-3 bacterium]
MGDKLVVLCTGSEGYLGSVLVSNLMSNSRVGLVIGVDACFFGENVRDTEGKYFLIRDRVERMERGWGYWLDELGPDVVISLAAISNDPACELNPSVTKLVNHYSVVHLAYECMLRKIKFVFASSASVYGSIDYHVGEWSPEFPISLYAKEKLETERDLFNMSTDEWKPQVFRMGTLFGVSGRPRFDLVIPLMLKDALLNSAIDVYGGNQWRPFLSLDVAAAMYELYVLGYLDSIKPVKNLVSFNARIIDLARSIARYV